MCGVCVHVWCVCDRERERERVGDWLPHLDFITDYQFCLWVRGTEMPDPLPLIWRAGGSQPCRPCSSCSRLCGSGARSCSAGLAGGRSVCLRGVRDTEVWLPFPMHSASLISKKDSAFWIFSPLFCLWISESLFPFPLCISQSLLLPVCLSVCLPVCIYLSYLPIYHLSILRSWLIQLWSCQFWNLQGRSSLETQGRAYASIWSPKRVWSKIPSTSGNLSLFFSSNQAAPD